MGDGTEIKDRIRELRKHFNLNQTEFGNKVGIKQTTVAGYETGTKKPLDSVILSICREFNANKDYLLCGTGEMLKQLTDQEAIMKYTGSLLKDTDSMIANAIKTFIVTYEQLDDASKAVLERVATDYLSNLKKGQ